MPTDDEIALGFYRFEDLQRLRIVKNRTDLKRKQDELGFPKAVKTGESQAGYLIFEVNAFVRRRVALRDAPKQIAAPPQPPHIAQPPREARPEKASKLKQAGKTQRPTRGAQSVKGS